MRLQLCAARVLLPLIVPYRLAFGEQRHFDVVVVGVRDEIGRIGWGEATILPGYTHETIEGAWAVAQDLIGKCRTERDLRTACWAAATHNPFATSAFLTALDWLNDHPNLNRAGRFPLLGTVNGKAEDRKTLENEIETLLAAGYRTLKIKVGWEVTQDLNQVRTVQSIVKGRAKLRIDGNQGYSREQAIAFLSGVDPIDVELLEQPCHADDWDSAVAIKQVACVPLMLDESIYTINDIGRAASLGCADFVKLKLMKLGNLETLDRGLKLITDNGMTAVLGNGVATDLGCWMEIAAALGTVVTAGEMNGFLKTRIQLLRPHLRMEGAEVILDGGRPELDIGAVMSHVISQTGDWIAAAA